MDLSRAYAILTVKSVSEDQRVITGTATTPSPDRMSDIVEPMGISFKNPLPLLWQHKSDKPCGTVKFDKPTAAGITFTASMPAVAEPGKLKDRIDEAWQSVKLGLVRGVSIGFRPIEYAFMDDGGVRFLKSEVVELSLVTIPANQDCSIATMKSIDSPLLAASGRSKLVLDPITKTTAGVSAATHSVKTKDKTVPKTIAEQLASFENTRAAKAARMKDLMDASGESGETLDTAQAAEYDAIEDDLKSIDAHLVRLRRQEVTNKAAAVEIPAGTDQSAASQARAGRVHATVRAAKTLAPGLAFTRYVISHMRTKGNVMQAAAIAGANEQWKAETPEVFAVLNHEASTGFGVVQRAAVAAGSSTDSTWAGPLVQYNNMASEFIEYLRPLTIIGRLPGLRYVPFKVKIPRQTGTSTAIWVGEGQAKPVSALAFDSVTLDIATISDIVIFSQQLAQLSQPSIEMLVRDDLSSRIVSFMDAQFVDPTVAAAGTTSPASITNGVTPTIASGTTLDAMRTDIGLLMQGFLEANLQLSNPVWIMSQVTAAKINLVRTSLGVKEYPDINALGGFLEGFPVITSQSVPATGGSPIDGYPIILANAGDILIADDGQVRIDASSEASLQLESSPDSPTLGTTTLISLFQQGLLAIKADRDINWAKRRSTAVAYISSARYTTA